MQTPRPRAPLHSELQFSDAAGCVRWLESLPFADSALTHEALSSQIELLARSEHPSPIGRLRILEILQRPVAATQQEFTRRYAGRPLPLSIMDYAVWNSVIELWQTLYGAYHDALDAALKGEPALQRHAALLALRCLECTGASMREHQRAYRAVPAGLWMQLHRVFAAAERAGLAGRPLDDPVGPAGASRSCVSAYAQALLAARANPYALSARQMDFTYRWLAMWAPLVRVTSQPPQEAAALAVDLGSRTGAIPIAGAVQSVSTRYLELDQMSRSMRRTIAWLQKGRSPAELGLGDECRQPGTEGLIELLHATIFGAGFTETATRREPGAPIEACVGIRAVQHELARTRSHATDDPAPTRTAPWTPLVEAWTLHHTGARTIAHVTRGPECEIRVQHHQLVGMRRGPEAPLQVGVVQRMELVESGDLVLAVRLFANASARPVELRRAGESPAGLPAVRAVLLTGSRVPETPSTLLVELGQFQPGLVVEMPLPPGRNVTLTHVVEQGVDFERIAFEG